MDREQCLLDGEITAEEFLKQLDEMINIENTQEKEKDSKN